MIEALKALSRTVGVEDRPWRPPILKFDIDHPCFELHLFSGRPQNSDKGNNQQQQRDAIQDDIEIIHYK